MVGIQLPNGYLWMYKNIWVWQFISHVIDRCEDDLELAERLEVGMWNHLVNLETTDPDLAARAIAQIKKTAEATLRGEYDPISIDDDALEAEGQRRYKRIVSELLDAINEL